jgi:glutamine cyclotransferase
MFRYYYLNDTDKIERGDEWTLNGEGWYFTNNSIGYINGEYKEATDNPNAWKVRRTIKTTPKGNRIIK